ncbi:hypothetical protein LUZ61_020759 [Rhynchospora tenuis]|uniref:Cupin type-1 domain-containing protein n=1 Tax=Rhynchospora tenuis TaxID=198213 RepID=A0AAD5ZE20_9POAL|nr:hypothetical protein LUZ61_020759 [Rhynchospora tenuis]
MEIDLAPKAPKGLYAGDGGSYSSWTPDDLPMLRVASIGAAKLTLNSRGFAAPSYSDSSKVAYVLQGSGVCGLTVPEATTEKVIRIKEGDALAIPFGFVTWWFNPNDSDLAILFLGDTSRGHRRGQFTDFHLTGPTGIFTGFTPEFVSRAWDLSDSDVSKLVHDQSNVGIVKLKVGQKMPEPSEKDRDGLVVNCHEAPLDVDIKGGGCVVVLNSKNLPTVELVTYVVKGSGRVQVVGVDGRRVLETKVSGGQLFIVPRFFVVSKIADPEGMEWFSIITTPNPVFSHLAGRTSVWKAISPEVLEAAFDAARELEQLFRSKRTSDEIFFPPK